jgi:hypothetical protein
LIFFLKLECDKSNHTIMNKFYKSPAFAALLCASAFSVTAADFFVASDGSDTNSGAKDKPSCSLHGTL